jgi:hypothetical protein
LAGTAQLASAVEAEQASTWMTPSTASRADVRADVDAAQRAGLLARNEASFTVTAAASDATLKRVQLTAEAREAMRLGLLPVHEGTRSATPADTEQIRQAGLRAVTETIAAK